ncbi:MAG: NapC/NirT family cytochrome c [Actinomycetes bacterium]
MAKQQNQDGNSKRPWFRTPAAITVAVVLGMVLVVLIGGTVVVSSPNACSVCHVMRPSVETWRVSPHAEVGCWKCHSEPHPWYLAPATLVQRWGMIGRDVNAQVRGEHLSVSYDASTTAPVPDSTCLQCHDPERTGTSKWAITIEHAKHAERNGTCVSCHLWTAHLDDETIKDSLMMARCFTCHGQPDQPTASRECGVCHPPGLDLKPVTHKSGEWLKAHGKASREDKQQCGMCHTQAACDACHGLVMPHPEGWGRGKTGHAVVAKQNRTTCTKCHEGDSNLCTMCHHTGFDEKKGPWVNQHFLMVQQTGTAFCFKCHEATYCIKCHTSNQPAQSAGGQ